MDLTVVDLMVFVGFMATVVAISLYAGRREESTEDYFLAGRSLGWGLIGLSLIASNISTEHFVGMAGQAFGRVGLAIASYEWMAAIVLVFVAWWLLPRFLSAGIYTMPEYLEYRYDRAARTTMAVYMLAAYVIVFLATVLFSGAVALNAVFDITGMFENRFGMQTADAEIWANVAGIWLIGIVAGCYTIYGGLKAVVWSDLLQGGALLVGGAIVAFLGLRLLGDGSRTSRRRLERGLRLQLVVVPPPHGPDLPDSRRLHGARNEAATPFPAQRDARITGRRYPPSQAVPARRHRHRDYGGLVCRVLVALAGFEAEQGLR